MTRIDWKTIVASTERREHSIVLRRSFSRHLTHICALCCFLWSSLSAQPIRFQALSTEHGLPNATVLSIIKDRQGFLWFGTQNGIARYDGYSFKSFQQKGSDTSGFFGEIVYAMMEDRAGQLWIATVGGGVNVLDPVTEQFTHYRNDQRFTTSLSDNKVYAVYQDHSGTIWIGTMKGLDRFDPGTNSFDHVLPSADDSLPHQTHQITAIYEHPDLPGTLWLGTGGDGVIRYDVAANRSDHIRFTQVTARGNSGNAIRYIVRQKQKNAMLWICSYGGLISYDVHRGIEAIYLHSPDDPHSISADEVRTILEDSNNNIWVGTSGGGLNLFQQETKRFIRYIHDPKDDLSITHNNVLTLFQDHTGLLWAGTREGISRFVDPQEQFQSFLKDPDNPNSLSSDFLYDIHEDSDTILWISTELGLNRYDPRNGTFLSYQTDPNNAFALKSNAIRTLFEDRDRTLWVGTTKGWVHRFSRTTGHSRSIAVTLNRSIQDGQEVRALWEDRNGTFWVGTTEGLFTIDKQRWSYAPAVVGPIGRDTTRTYFISTLYEDAQGILWFSVRNQGIIRYDKKKNEVRSIPMESTDSSFMLHSTVTSFIEDRKGSVWITTGTGRLEQYDPLSERFVTRFRADKGFTNIIYGALIDTNGTFWMGTNNGLCRFDPATSRSQVYTTRQGIHTTEFNSRSFCESATGILYFGGTSGMVAFHPEKIRDNIHVPPIMITKVKVFEEDVVTDTSINFCTQLILPYNNNYLSFEFAALDYNDPKENRYAYILEGADRDWIDSKSRRYAAYSNLNPGTYTLKVKGSNNNGVWNEQGASLTITILPAVWQTAWFRICTGLIVIGILSLLYYRNVDRLKKEKRAQQDFSRKLIELEERERKRLASELHDGLGQDLLIVSNELQQFAMSGQTDPDTMQRISGLVQESIDDIRIISSDLHPHHLERLGFCAAVDMMVQKVFHASPVKIHVQCDRIDDLIPQKHKIHYYRIIQESLTNIVKYSFATEARLEMCLIDQRIEITLSDNGAGFHPDAIVPANGNNHSTNGYARGFGIASMEERARISGAMLTMTSAPGHGTTIRLTIPLTEG